MENLKSKWSQGWLDMLNSLQPAWTFGLFESRSLLARPLPRSKVHIGVRKHVAMHNALAFLQQSPNSKSGGIGFLDTFSMQDIGLPCTYTNSQQNTTWLTVKAGTWTSLQCSLILHFFPCPGLVKFVNRRTRWCSPQITGPVLLHVVLSVSKRNGPQLKVSWIWMRRKVRSLDFLTSSAVVSISSPAAAWPSDDPSFSPSPSVLEVLLFID